MQITRYFIGITPLSGVFAYALASCTAEPHESAEDPEVKTLPATSDEVIPVYGINFARFPMTTPINEYATLTDNHVPYARVNFGFDPHIDINKLLEPIDRGMSDAATNGIYVLPVIFTPPLPNDAGEASAFLRSLETFTGQLAKLYGPNSTFANTHPQAGVIRAWEIHNEPNLNIFSVGNANAYRCILRAARKGLRNGDPRARIVFGGLSSVTNASEVEGTASDFLREVLTPSNRCLVDAVAYHPYAHTPEVAQERADTIVSVMRDELHLIGGPSSRDDAQFWITELGWGIAGDIPGPSVIDEDQQAQSIRRVAFLSNQSRETWRLGPTMWYVYTDEVAAGQTGWAAVAGVYKSDDRSPHIRPAWDVIGNFARQDPWIQLPAVHICPTGRIPTQTYLTLDGYQNGTPGTASVSGNIFRDGGCAAADGTVNVNFQKLVNGTWTTMSTAQPTLVNGHYEVLNWGVGVGQWRVRAVFPEQGDYAMSESDYREFEIQRVATNAFLSLDQVLNGQPGYASVSGNVLRTNSDPVSGTVNVNFQKLVNGTWMTMSTAQRTLSNGSYDVPYWGVGVGQWRVRAVFPEQGDYAASESNYHEFEVKSGYRLVNRHSDKCMSLSGNNGANGTAILQWDCSGSPSPGDGQVFTLYPLGGGDFNIMINSTGKCVDVTGVSQADGAYLQQWDCLGAGQRNQVWRVIPIAGQPPYVAFQAQHSGKCADVLGAGTANGVRIDQWGCHWGGNQQWNFQAVN